MYIKCLALVVALATTLSVGAGAATLIGQWDFNGSNPLENKAAGTNWSTMTPSSSNYTVSDGGLTLNRTGSGSWPSQTSATAKLETDFGPSGYFQNVTQVAWMTFADAYTGLWGHMMSLCKHSAPDASLGNILASTDIDMCNGQYGGRYCFEDPIGTQQQGFNYTSSTYTLPVDTKIKVALVRYWDDPWPWQRDCFYWDLNDGNGLVEVLNGFVWEHQVTTFGQYGSQSVLAGSTSSDLRYDALTLMGFEWTIPDGDGSVTFDEARVYSGTLSAAEIAALQPNAVPEPASLIYLLTGVVGLAGFATRRRK